MPKKGEYDKFRNYERKIKRHLITYAYFERILLPENNGMKNPNESYRNKYQKHIAWSYGYKLVCVDYKFSKLFKTYLGKDLVYNFFNSMIKESWLQWRDEKPFNKELVMTKDDNEDFKNSTKC